MELKPGMIKDIEQARVGAEAEKPLRDLAREKDITPEEKEVIDNIAIRRGESAMENYLPEDGQKTEPEKKDENSELVAKTIELIKKSPELTFFAFGIGNVSGEPGNDTMGGHGYCFDYKTQSMVMAKNFDFVDNRAGLEPFKSKWTIYNDNKDENKKYVAVKFPFLAGFGDLKNPYVTDTRGGCHLTLAIHYDLSTLSSLGSKEIEEKIKNQDMAFFKNLILTCGEEFIPGYFNHIKDLYKKYNEKTK